MDRPRANLGPRRAARRVGHACLTGTLENASPASAQDPLGCLQEQRLGSL